MEIILDAIQRKCLACGEPFIAVSRRQKYCRQNCRPSVKNQSDGSLRASPENQDLACLQTIDFIEADSHENPKQKPLSLPLHFEHWPPKLDKRAPCVTYKLTDGRQINTGYGRASRALGFIMEISPGRWMARVGNQASEVLPLGAAKKACKELYLSGNQGEPRNWIDYANRIMAAELDGCKPEQIGIDPPQVTQRLNQDGTFGVDVMWGSQAAEYPSEEYPEDVAFQTLAEWGFCGNFAMRWPNGFVATYKRIPYPEASERPSPNDGPTPGAIQGDYPLDTYDDGYPKLPGCLDRRPKPPLADAA